jgi:hypothetical protein
LFDAGSGFGDFAQGLADACLSLFIGGGDVDVEALCSDYFAGVVVSQPFTDGDDVAGFALDGDDAVVIALIESPQVCSPKFPTCEQRSVYRLASAGGGAAQGFGGGVVVA